MLAFASAPAAADRGSVHVVGNGDLALTDNVFSEQRGNQNADLFIQVRPGILMSYGMPRMIHDLNLEGEATGYAIHGNDASLHGRGGWRALFLPTARTEVILQVNAGSSLLNAIATLTAPDQTTATLQPVGRITALTVDATQFLSYVASREVRLSQTLIARGSETDDHLPDPTITRSAEGGGELGIERAFETSALSLEVGASVVRFERIAPDTALMRSRLDRQLNPRARLRYRHDLDRKLSLGVDGGAVYVHPYGSDPYDPGVTGRSSGIFPVAGIGVSYLDGWGAATATLRRDVTPNLFVAQNTVNDGATVAAAIPLSWRVGGSRRAPKLVGMFSVSALRTQLVDPVTSDTTSSFALARVDVGFMYAFRPGLSYGVRYELMVQSGDRSAETPINGFFRNTIYATFRIRYPDDVAFSVPRRRTNASRADRKDLAPLGSEPAIPDLLGEGEGDR